MKKLILLALLATLSGCIATQPSRYISPEEQQAIAECDYETEVALTGQSLGVWIARKPHLTRQCLAAKGY